MEKKKMNKCPICGALELVNDVRDMPYSYKGQTTIIPNVKADYCANCRESILGSDESKRVMETMQSFHKRIGLME